MIGTERRMRGSIFLAVALGLSLGLTGIGNKAQAAFAPIKAHLKLSYGWSFLSNKGGNIDTIRMGEDWKSVVKVPDWKAEFLVAFGDYLGASFGLGRTSFSCGGDYTYEWSHYEIEWSEFLIREKDIYSQQFKVSALAAQLNVYGFLPLGKFNAYVFAGPGLYFGDYSHDLAYDLSYYYYQRFFDPMEERILDAKKHLDLAEKAKGATLGFQGGIGLEFQVLPFVSIGLEAMIKRVGFHNWKGTSTSSYQGTDENFTTASGWTSTSDSWTHTAEGTLWYGYLELPHSHAMADYLLTLFISENTPGGSWYADQARNADINFHAFDLILTLKFHF
jgi:hypothetical protein